MRPTDRPAIVALVSDVLAYYRQPVSEFTLSVWWSACQAFELEQVRRALTQHATDPERGQFAPKVADIVRLLSGTTTDRAALAWGKLHEAMSAVGAYQDVIFDDPAIHAAVEDCGGWPKVCRTELKDLSFLQHRFSQAHKAYTARGDFGYSKRLAGDRSPDSEYEKKGIPLPRPAVIGDPEQAKLVYQTGGTGKAALTFQSVEALSAPSLHRIENRTLQ